MNQSTTLPKKVKIVEVGPRDGLQNEKQFVENDIKIDLINQLSAAGFPNVEAAAFVSPKWVPQMAGSDEVMRRIARKPNTIYSVLTPNMQGLEKALEVKADEIVIFGAASEAFSQKNINCSIEESIARFIPVVNTAKQAGVRTAPGFFVSARVVAFHPAQILPYKDVAAEVKRQVSQRAAEKLAVAAAAEKFSALEKDPKNASGFASPLWVSRNKPTNLVGPALDDVMSINPDKFPAVVSVSNPGIGATLYRVDQVRQPTAVDAKVHKAQAQQIQALAAQSEFAGFMSYWRDAASVKVINPLKPLSSGSGS